MESRIDSNKTEDSSSNVKDMNEARLDRLAEMIKALPEDRQNLLLKNLETETLDLEKE